MNRLPRSAIDIAAFGLRSGLSSGGLSQRNERNFMMNHTNGWMGGWAGGGMWLWAVIGVAVVVLLVVVIGKLSKK
jgi:anti-sigma-K factor RskA